MKVKKWWKTRWQLNKLYEENAKYEYVYAMITELLVDYDKECNKPEWVIEKIRDALNKI